MAIILKFLILFFFIINIQSFAVIPKPIFALNFGTCQGYILNKAINHGSDQSMPVVFDANVTAVPGIFDQAVYMSAGKSFEAGLLDVDREFSLSFWYKPSVTPTLAKHTYQMLLSNTKTIGGYGIELKAEAKPYSSVYKLQLSFVNKNYKNTKPYSTIKFHNVCTSEPCPWFFIAITYNGRTNLKLYISKALEQSFIFEDYQQAMQPFKTAVKLSPNLKFNAYSNLGTKYRSLNATYDEIRIFDEVLSAHDLEVLKASQMNGNNDIRNLKDTKSCKPLLALNFGTCQGHNIDLDRNYGSDQSMPVTFTSDIKVVRGIFDQAIVVPSGKHFYAGRLNIEKPFTLVFWYQPSKYNDKHMIVSTNEDLAYDSLKYGLNIQKTMQGRFNLLFRNTRVFNADFFAELNDRVSYTDLKTCYKNCPWVFIAVSYDGDTRLQLYTANKNSFDISWYQYQMNPSSTASAGSTKLRFNQHPSPFFTLSTQDSGYDEIRIFDKELSQDQIRALKDFHMYRFTDLRGLRDIKSCKAKLAFNFGTCKFGIFDIQRNHGLMQNDPVNFSNNLDLVEGIFDKSIFLPQDEYLTVGALDVESPFTLSFWFKPKAYNPNDPYKHILASSNEKAKHLDKAYGLSLILTNSESSSVYARFMNTRYKLINADGLSQESHALMPACTNNCPWLFIAFSYNGISKSTLYVSRQDARDLATKAYLMIPPGQSSQGSAKLRFGKHPILQYNKAGAYDEVRLFDRVFSKQELLALKNTQMNGNIDINGLKYLESCKAKLAFNFGTCENVNKLNMAKNHGTKTNVSTNFDEDITLVEGIFDQAIYVPSGKHFIAGSIDIDKPFTLSFWYQPSRYNDKHMIVSSNEDANYDSTKYGLNIQKNTLGRFNILFRNKHFFNQDFFASLNDDEHANLETCHHNCPWLFIAATYDGASKLGLYVSKRNSSHFAYYHYDLLRQITSQQGVGTLRFNYHPSNSYKNAVQDSFYDEVRLFDTSFSKTGLLTLKHRQKSGKSDIFGLNNRKRCKAKLALNFGTCQNGVVKLASNYGFKQSAAINLENNLLTRRGIFDQALYLPKGKHFTTGKLDIEKPFTLSFWFKPINYNPNYEHILLTTNEQSSAYNEQYGFSISLTNHGSIGFDASFINTKHKTAGEYSLIKSTHALVPYCTNNCPWFFIAVSYDGVNSPTLYVSRQNARSLAAKTYVMATSGKPIQGNSKLRFGKHAILNSNQEAIYDEIRIFQGNLSKQELLALKHAQMNGNIDIDGLKNIKVCKLRYAFTMPFLRDYEYNEAWDGNLSEYNLLTQTVNKPFYIGLDFTDRNQTEVNTSEQSHVRVRLLNAEYNLSDICEDNTLHEADLFSRETLANPYFYEFNKSKTITPWQTVYAGYNDSGTLDNSIKVASNERNFCMNDFNTTCNASSGDDPSAVDGSGDPLSSYTSSYDPVFKINKPFRKVVVQTLNFTKSQSIAQAYCSKDTFSIRPKSIFITAAKTMQDTAFQNADRNAIYAYKKQVRQIDSTKPSAIFKNHTNHSDVKRKVSVANNQSLIKQDQKFFIKLYLLDNEDQYIADTNLSHINIDLNYTQALVNNYSRSSEISKDRSFGDYAETNGSLKLYGDTARLRLLLSGASEQLIALSSGAQRQQKSLGLSLNNAFANNNTTYLELPASYDETGWLELNASAKGFSIDKQQGIRYKQGGTIKEFNSSSTIESDYSLLGKFVPKRFKPSLKIVKFLSPMNAKRFIKASQSNTIKDINGSSANVSIYNQKHWSKIILEDFQLGFYSPDSSALVYALVQLAVNSNSKNYFSLGSNKGLAKGFDDKASDELEFNISYNGKTKDGKPYTQSLRFALDQAKFKQEHNYTGDLSKVYKAASFPLDYKLNNAHKLSFYQKIPANFSNDGNLQDKTGHAKTATAYFLAPFIINRSLKRLDFTNPINLTVDDFALDLRDTSASLQSFKLKNSDSSFDDANKTNKDVYVENNDTNLKLPIVYARIKPASFNFQTFENKAHVESNFSIDFQLYSDIEDASSIDAKEIKLKDISILNKNNAVKLSPSKLNFHQAGIFSWQEWLDNDVGFFDNKIYLETQQIKTIIDKFYISEQTKTNNKIQVKRDKDNNTMYKAMISFKAPNRNRNFLLNLDLSEAGFLHGDSTGAFDTQKPDMEFVMKFRRIKKPSAKNKGSNFITDRFIKHKAYSNSPQRVRY